MAYPSAPKLQLTVPAAWLQLPCDAVAETKVAPAGSVSVRVTPLADEGPRFCTRRLYVSGLPICTGSG